MLHTDLQIVSATFGMLSTAMMFIGSHQVAPCGMDEATAAAAAMRRRRFNSAGVSLMFLAFAGSMANAVL